MSKRILFSILSILFFSLGEIVAQDKPIYLSNASFEDFPRPSHPPRGWNDCGDLKFPDETPPDVHPTPGHAFGVAKKANDGDTYLGLVVRENDSWESVSQRLARPLEAGKCYSFSIHLSMSETYVSSLKEDRTKDVNFSKPLKLKIWGGNGYCRKVIQLGETGLVSNTDWKKFDFTFEPDRRVTYIILEAFYQTPIPLFSNPPNGNILLDNASPIQPIPCDEEPVAKKPEIEITNPSSKEITVTEKSFDLLAKVLNVNEKRKILLKVNGRNNRSFSYNSNSKTIASKLNLKKGKNTISIRVANKEGNATAKATIIYEPPVVKVDPVDEPKKSKIEEGLVKLKPGETLRVDELFFDINSFKITEVSKPVLEDIFNFLNTNRQVKVEIGGHTNRNCDTKYCNELSESRAKAVVEYLVQKGILKDRLSYKGYGKTDPVTFSTNAELQKKNQRVEIKVLSIGG